MAGKGQVMEHTIFVVVVASIMGLHRLQTVDIDASMIIIDVVELLVLVGVELDSKNMIADLAVVLWVEQAQVLAWQPSREILAWSDKECHAMCTQVGMKRDDAEHKGDREGLHQTILGLAEMERSWVECVALHVTCSVRQLEQPIWGYCCCTVKGEVGAGEARVDKLVVTGAENNTVKAENKEEIPHSFNGRHHQGHG